MEKMIKNIVKEAILEVLKSEKVSFNIAKAAITNKSIKPTPKLMSIAQAAKHLGIGRDNLYRLSEAMPDIPIIKVNGIKKVNIPMMELWIDEATKNGIEL